MPYRLSNWASKVCLAASELTIIGAIITLFYPRGEPFGALGLAIGFFGFLFHYPVLSLGPTLLLLQYSYLFNFILSAGVAVPLFIFLPTNLGGLAFLLGALLYLMAWFRKEKTLTFAQVKLGWRARIS